MLDPLMKENHNVRIGPDLNVYNSSDSNCRDEDLYGVKINTHIIDV